jgi:hypothetical protein
MPKNTDNNGRDSTGKFAQGNKGKPKGAQNRTTKELRCAMLDFLHSKTDQIETIWNELDPKDRATLYLQIAKLVLPKPELHYIEERTETEVSVMPAPIIVLHEEKPPITIDWRD